MAAVEEKNLRYFLEIDRESLKVINVGHDHKDNLDQGRQLNTEIHRVFVTKGQYNSFVSRCEVKSN